MTKIKYIKGDLFGPVSKIANSVLIPHIVNDVGGWGAGFVVPLGRTYPAARLNYQNWALGKIPTKDFALGETQFVEVNQTPNITVCNMIGQHGVGGTAIRYVPLGKCMELVAGLATATDSEIHAPMFGAGLAGGYWPFIAELIAECWLSRQINVSIYYLEGTLPFAEELLPQFYGE